MLQKYIRDIESHIKQLENETKEFKNTLKQAQSNALNYEALESQFVRNGFIWKNRDETPPHGWVWASDGMHVWLIQGRGKPISKEATQVLYWTEALIPTPPDLIED